MDNDWARPVVHFEIEALDPDVLIPFYREMFNWEIGDGFIRNFHAGLGGPEPGPAGHFRQGSRSGVTLFIQVRNLEESLERCSQLGGAATLARLQIPDGPAIAGITDPEGNPITLVQQ